MFELVTSLEIEASIEQVWDTLTDFPAHSDWNPFIKKIEGDCVVGETVTVVVSVGGGLKSGRPIIEQVLEHQKVVLFSKRGLLFSGRHYFLLETLPSGQVLFTHGEEFSGLIPFFFQKKLSRAFTSAFESMNLALKAKLESS